MTGVLDDSTGSAPAAATRGCPVIHEEFSAPRTQGAHWALADRLREQGGVHWNDQAQGWWMFTSNAAVRDIFRYPQLFSSRSITPWDPDPAYVTVPTMIDGQEHLRYRRLLNPWFTAENVRRHEDAIRAIARRRVAEIEPRKRCNFPVDFALEYTTELYLQFTGMPTEDTPKLRAWVDDFFSGYGGDPNAQEAMGNAVAGLTEYLQIAVAERRTWGGAREGDFASRLMYDSQETDRPFSDQELVDLLLLAIIGGLDTTSSQLSYLFRHLAGNAGDRRRLLDDPEVVPLAIEEGLRFFPILMGDGRKVTQDTEFHGVELKEGDMVWAVTSAANRDPNVYERANEFVVDRKKNQHATFALGPHRCLGMHLARTSMRIATEEWLAVIPHFRLDADGVLEERGAGSMLSPLDVPLAWD
ncbi:Cytochrome P450 [Jatrophihabitans endophyticus]|uniref:Cytochrome P450 n=1 Tax=Jatrophihabitans endophyticus TaxID=1206085 RepID=A0A1M5PY96_9ACTN|nr:cytochrome P450 [Jatrophihabitans endophyticus]SHH06632.1 Cytochrome P450 [Jatrophihabitans endophyticus]